MNKTLVLVLAAGCVLTSSAAVRRLKSVQIVEGESVTVPGQNAQDVRSSNGMIFSTVLRDGEVVLSGLRIGEGEYSLVDDRGVFASGPVTVAPSYWQLLKKLFQDDPEIAVEIVGEKVIVSGATANVETLRRVKQAKEFDPARIVSQVTYSTEAIAILVDEFLKRSEAKDVRATIVGHEVCLSGSAYDNDAIKRLGDRVRAFLADFPGVTVNTDAMRVLKQKISIHVEFLSYDVVKARNLGLQTPDQISAVGSFEYGWELNDQLNDKAVHTLKSLLSNENTDTGSRYSTSSYGSSAGGAASSSISSGTSASRDSTSKSNWSRESDDPRTHEKKQTWTMNSKVKVNDVKVQLNLAKKNGVTKEVYSTTLATQSGEEVEFQNGGTLHYQVSDLYKADSKEIDYGYIVKAKPVILDEGTVNLAFEVENKQVVQAENPGDRDVTRYHTKSHYMVRPGESIVLSGFNKIADTLEKTGTPWLSRIPWIGEWLFGNRASKSEDAQMLLVVTINWALEDGTAEAVRKATELRERKVEVEMP